MPFFSPDGEKIVFAANRIDYDGHIDIWIMNRDGTNQRQLTFDEAEDNYPFFSPNGKKVVFASTRTGAFDIWMLELK